MFITRKNMAKLCNFLLPIPGIFTFQDGSIISHSLSINHLYIISSSPNIPQFLSSPPAASQARTIRWGIGRLCRAIASAWCGDPVDVTVEVDGVVQ